MEYLLNPMMVPIIALLIPIVWIIATHLARSHTEQQIHETVRLMIEKGMPVPDELMRQLVASAGKSPGESVRAGNSG